ncbi:MAG: hypothetical protein A2W98_08525 [Bacteroidetes bacterium GWF2_33_38]|nr:MAG: hypothetical protein A2W98_08525 [Bacteroidetes bacterium GWF2_33_38]OFY72813.1 MAG: hypothetical protein A2265_08635 [Bacteroidetes bacterium RIFOXYA12_FULL_33_9]
MSNSNKIGRNAPCPCGSGKKNKYCCNLKYSNFVSEKEEKVTVSEYKKFVSSYDKFDLLKTIAAAQLLPLNHGKNVRFEILARDLVLQEILDKPEIDYKNLQDFFMNNFKSHYLEDPVSSFFTENIIWFFGNFTVFPGLNHNGTRILNSYLEAIFTMENLLPDSYKKTIRDAATIVLAMCESMAMNAGLKRYIYEEYEHSEIKIPKEGDLSRFKDIVSFQTSHLQKIAIHYQVDLKVIEKFVVDLNDENFKNDDPDKNPLLTKPLYKNNDEYIFALPTASVNCLTEFITKTSKDFGCHKELMNYYYTHQWRILNLQLEETGWKLTDITLPETKLNIKESVFRIDNDKLAYVCYVKSGQSQESVDLFSSQSGEINFYDNRNNEVLEFLEKVNQNALYKYFTLYIIGESGYDFYFFHGGAINENQVLALKHCEFESLVFSNELDPLTLWKFARIQSKTRNRTQIIAPGGFLDTYFAYKNNNQSLLHSDYAVPDLMNFAIGSSSNYEREIIKQRDEHSTLQYTEQHGLIPVPVIKYREYAPIYKEREKSRECNLLIECFSIPVWVKNNQATKPEEKNVIHFFCESAIFWLYKMRLELSKYIEEIKSESLEFILILDNDLLKTKSALNRELETSVNLHFDVRVENNKIYLKVPDLTAFLLKPTNEAEKLIMKNILKGLSLLVSYKNEFPILEETEITNIVDSYLKPDSAKMILYYDSSKNLILDNRWLSPLRKIQECETSSILNGIVDSLNQTVPEKIKSKDDKIRLCNKIVGNFITEILHELKQYDSVELLKWLIKLQERCTYQREFSELLIPAKISCFSDFPTEVIKLQKSNKELVETNLSLRCLIEFIAAQPSFESKCPNMDDVDRLVALMVEVINWGILSDSMDLGLDDPEMGLLPSGRIGVDKSFYYNHIETWSEARVAGEIFKYQQRFDENFSLHESVINAGETEETKEIDEAFEQEWGISLTWILKLKGCLVRISIENEESVTVMNEIDIVEKIKTYFPDFNNDVLLAGLTLLSLTERKAIDKAPDGFSKTDIYPWRYNRALSYIRRPLVKIEHKEETTILWSYRYVLSSKDNLLSLLYSGRLKAKGGGKLEAFLKKRNNEKGKEFRDEVCNWLENQKIFKVIPYEVKPKDLSGKEEDGVYGDIDILAIDEKKRVFYSIECKNTVSARVMHEMKTELDNYLGRDGNEGLIEKHVKRDLWLKHHIELLSCFCSTAKEFEVKSLILTSEEIPLYYLAKEKIKLPVISFVSLKRQGINILN